MNYHKKYIQFLYRITTLITMQLFVQDIIAQICADPANVIYGVTNAGTIHPITVGSGIAGAQLNPLGGNAPVSSNGIGYCPLNGRFYYFKRMPGSAPQEFVSFDPATNATVILSNCPTVNYVYVGGINPSGTGYYCWDSNATLFYYRISTNTWITITSTIVDRSGNDVDAIIRSHGSGDLAIDGIGNMLMLPSSNSRMALYRMDAPLPVTPVASIAVTQLMPLTNPPAKFGGIALNATGQIFLNATAPTNGLYRLEQNMSLTFISTVSSPMGDLTSCNFPFGVLAAGISDFKVSLSENNHAILTWKRTQEINSIFHVEHSYDGEKWTMIGGVNSEINRDAFMKFIHDHPSYGRNHYRLYYSGLNQIKVYSEIRQIEVTNGISIILWPNPVQSLLTIINNDNSEVASMLTIIDPSGRVLIGYPLQNGRNVLRVDKLTTGNYIVLIRHKSGRLRTYKLVKY